MLLIRMLGSLSVEREGAPLVHLEGQRYGAILAHLALRPGRALSRDALIAAHWPGVSPAVARNRLSGALHALRKILEDDPQTLLRADRQSVSLDPDQVQTDVQLFERACEDARRATQPSARRSALEAAWRLYAGPLLQGLPREAWLHIERERLACAHEDIEKALQIEEAVPPPVATVATVARVEGGGLGGLPQPRTRFFGRQGELGILQGIVSEGGRLITILGPGGMGKTRLALEAARRMVEGGQRREALWVPLADARSREALERALLVAAGQGAALGAPLSSLVAGLAGRGAVVVVDNAEQLVEEVAAVLDGLLLRTADVVVVVTSQRTLLLEGEHVLRLGPLAEEGAALLLDRLRHHRPDYRPDVAEQAALVALSARVDAVPLALELAAVRLRQGTVADAVQRLDLAALVDPRRQRPTRQRSLEEALEWTLGLVAPPLQEAFVQLSVFRGEISVEAAEAVLGRPRLETVLQELADCSLLEPVASFEGRYRMLPTVRALAAARVPADERAALRDRFSAWWRTVAERWNGALMQGQGQAQALAPGLERDWPNLEAALEMVTTAAAVAMLANTVIHVLWTGRAREVLPWLERLAAAPDQGDLPRALQVNLVRCGHRLAVVSGQAEAAQRWRERAQALLDAGLTESESVGLWSELAVAAIDRGALSLAREIGERLVRFQETSGHPRNLAVTLDALARAHFFAGEYTEALALLERAAALPGVSGDPQLIEAIESLQASCLLERGEKERGVAVLEGCLARRRALGQAPGAAMAMSLALAHLHRGELVEARRQAAAAESAAGGDRRLHAYAQGVQAQVLLACGAWQEASLAAEAAEAAFVEMVRPVERPRLALVRATCLGHLRHPTAPAVLRGALETLLAIEGHRHLAHAQEAIALLWPGRAPALDAAVRAGTWRTLIAAWLAEDTTDPADPPRSEAAATGTGTER